MNSCNFDGLTGRVVTPDDPLYNELRQVYNRAIQKYPLAIVFCLNQSDVSNAVLWARRYGISLRIRNGGHNYEGYSTGSDVLDLDLSEMDRISLDEEAGLVTVQGAVKNRQLYDFLSSKGYPFPGGTCPSAGVSGYALGGGWGLSCRYLGLGCDSLTELQMVNYEGSIITAGPRENADLFWACRGAGGGNFGVVVSMTFRLPRKVNKVTLVEIRYPQADQEKQALFLQTWQDWLKNADLRITMVSRIFNSSLEGLAILARGIFYGAPEEALGIISPLIELGGAKYSLKYLSFLEAITIIGDFYPPFEKFKSASRFVLRDFNSCESLKIAGLIKERPEGSVYTSLSFYALGGRVSEVPEDATAFYYRDARYITWLDTVFEQNKCENAAWLADKFSYLKSVTNGSYVNFPYGSLSCFPEEYYGTHVCRLKKVKEAYDPLNVFTFPQGIGEFHNPGFSSSMCCGLQR
ncbi:FAD-binding oxidoreductase [Lachnospiraceae bacterium 54-53]